MQPVYTMRFPKKYVFGEGALDQIGQHLVPLGKKFLLLTGCGPITEEVTNRIRQSVAEVDGGSGCELIFEDVDTQPPTLACVTQLGERVKKDGIDVVVGIGGGRALDIARGQEHYSKSKVALVATSAATNAVGTRIQVIFADDSCTTLGPIHLSDTMTELVLIDSGLVVKAPPRTLSAGFGDAFASAYEGLTSAKKFDDYRDSSFAWAILEDGLDTFYSEGLQAMDAAKAGVVTPAYNHVIEHIMFANGMGTSNLRGGMSLPHLIGDGTLMFLETEEHRFMHGHLVGYGVLPMMVERNFPLEEIYRYVDFMQAVEVPVNFGQLGIQDFSRDKLYALCEKSMESMVLKLTRNVITPQDIFKNMMAADSIVNTYLASK
ncbi:MAG: glycerol dehydrogenase [Ruminococcaceae bacterium]|nr:glycerol dehydrogenase [Oscillospiraceae bacterium]